MAQYGNDVCRIEFDSSGFRALLTSSEMQDAVYGVASPIAADAGDGFEARPFLGNQAGRWMATVDAATDEARREW